MINLIKRRSENNLAKFEMIYTYKGKSFCEKEITRGNEGTTHITFNSYLHEFIHCLDTSEQRSSTVSQLAESVVPNHLHRRMLSQRQVPRVRHVSASAPRS